MCNETKVATLKGAMAPAKQFERDDQVVVGDLFTKDHPELPVQARGVKRPGKGSVGIVKNPIPRSSTAYYVEVGGKICVYHVSEFNHLDASAKPKPMARARARRK